MDIIYKQSANKHMLHRIIVIVVNLQQLFEWKLEQGGLRIADFESEVEIQKLKMLGPI